MFHRLGELAGVVAQITVVWRPLGSHGPHFGAAQILKHGYLRASPRGIASSQPQNQKILVN